MGMDEASDFDYDSDYHFEDDNDKRGENEMESTSFFEQDKVCGYVSLEFKMAPVSGGAEKLDSLAKLATSVLKGEEVGGSSTRSCNGSLLEGIKLRPRVQNFESFLDDFHWTVCPSLSKGASLLSHRA